MSQKIETIDYACNVVRREVQEEFKDLTLFFIVHAPGKRTEALENKTEELLDHPAGAFALPVLKKLALERRQTSRLAIIAKTAKKKLVPLFVKNKTLSVFFVNAGEYTDENKTRQQIHHLAWHALSLLENIRTGNVAHYKQKNNLFMPMNDIVGTARENMLADVFSAILAELEGKRGAIRALAKERCLMTLTPTVGHKAEEFPYPLAAESAQIVFDELTDESTKLKPVTHASTVTREIGITYDDTAIYQWSSFAMAAQEMAWMNYDKNKIMSTALYTSEDPYTRATAHIAAETLNMEPSPITSLGNYNPFTEQEANQRLHKKICADGLKTLLSNLEKDDPQTVFRTMAKKQNAQMMLGSLLGWNAVAIMKAAEALHAQDDRGLELDERVKEAYRHLKAQMGWKTLLEFSHLILDKRREGIQMTPELIIELCREDKNYTQIAAAFEWAPPNPQTGTH